MIFVDSSVWIDYFNGNDTSEADRLDLILGVTPVCTGDIVLVEVLQGFRRDKDFEIAKELLNSLRIFNIIDAESAFESAGNFRSLRKRDITIRKTIDVIIATFCIKNDIPLLFSDKDFIPFQKHLKLRSAMAD